MYDVFMNLSLCIKPERLSPVACCISLLLPGHNNHAEDDDDDDGADDGDDDGDDDDHAYGIINLLLTAMHWW